MSRWNSDHPAACSCSSCRYAESLDRIAANLPNLHREGLRARLREVMAGRPDPRLLQQGLTVSVPIGLLQDLLEFLSNPANAKPTL